MKGRCVEQVAETVEVIINKGKEENTDIKNQNLTGEVRK
jgi:hypothetical protein